MRGPALVAAAALSVWPAAAPPQTGQPVPEPTVMIVEFPEGAPMIGFPRRCPGAPADEDDSEWICLAELYQGRIEIIRHLSGPRARRGEFVRLTAHARNWYPGLQMIVATVPFRDGGITGRFAWWWHLPEANDDFCLPTEELPGSEEHIRRAFESGYLRRFKPFGYIERVEARCIRG